MVRRFALAASLVLTLACGGSSSGGDGGPREAGIATCARYLECAVATMPSAVGPLLESYGPDGVCWDDASPQAIDLCTMACEKAREGLAVAFPDEAACGDCSDEYPCPERRTCDPATYTCVQCLSDEQCGADRTHCADKRCVQCISDDHCEPGWRCSEQRCEPRDKVCEPGELRCTDDRLEACDEQGVAWTQLENCASKKLVCDPDALACAKKMVCTPNQDFCEFDAQSGLADVYACSADGTDASLKTRCVGQGRTCYQGQCVVTEYGPCIQGNTACLKDGDECLFVEDSESQPHYVCAPPCGDDCPAALPPGAPGDGLCYTGRCMLNCEFDGMCPPGMHCVGSLTGVVCTWAT